MRELASQGNVDPESVIQYIIDGIPDSSSKVMLYGARDYSEFRTRLRTYEKIQTKGATSSKGNLRRELMGKPTGDDTKSSKGDQKKVTRTTDHCYNCGESGHKSNLCKFKERGKKCFKCNDFGHESKNCPGTGKSDSGSIQAATNALVKSIK